MNRKWWKAYFFLVATMTIVVFIAPILIDSGEEAVWWDWIHIPLYLAEIVGLFGFVYGRRLANPILWQFVFAASIAYEVWDLYSIAAEPALGAAYTGFLVGIVIATLLLQIPMWIALFSYGFRCKELWRGAT